MACTLAYRGIESIFKEINVLNQCMHTQSRNVFGIEGVRKSPNECYLLQIVCRAHALSMHTMHTPTRAASGGNCMIMSIYSYYMPDLLIAFMYIVLTYS